MSLHLVLCVVTVMTIIASAMSALGLMNLNLTQSYYNGSIALNEAEAGISRMLYNIREDANYGLSNEEIYSKITPDMTINECYHRISFKNGNMSGIPWSTNAKNSAKTGYNNRTVPKDMIHAVSTGYCRGQYRTIEVLVHKPPFPYALAASGRIESSTPLYVDGVNNAQEYVDGKSPEPGHILSNYIRTGTSKPNPSNPQDCSIFIGESPKEKTYISGFVQSASNVNIKGTPTIKGGIRQNTDTVELPFINTGNYFNKDETGVINLCSDTFPAQEMDAMYYHAGNLTYSGSVKMDNAFLFMENGNLTINGGLSGVGAIIIKNGNVTINGDTTLSGTNKIALICDGDINLNGYGNSFQGIVYSHGNINASNITVVGNCVVDGRDAAGKPDQNKSTQLDNCKFVKNTATGTISFTAHSSSEAKSGYSGYSCDYNYGMPCLLYVDKSTGQLNIGSDPSIDPDTKNRRIDYYDPADPESIKNAFTNPNAYKDNKNLSEKTKEKIAESIKTAKQPVQGMQNLNDTEIFLKNIRVEDFRKDLAADAGFLADQVNAIKGVIENWQAVENEVEDCQIKINELEVKKAATPPTIKVHHPDPPPKGSDTDEPNPAYVAIVQEIDTKKAEQTALMAQKSSIQLQYENKIDELAKSMNNYYKQHCDSNGRYNTGGKNIDVTKAYNLDLNSFLSNGSDLRIKYWHVFNHKM